MSIFNALILSGAGLGYIAGRRHGKGGLGAIIGIPVALIAYPLFLLMLY